MLEADEIALRAPALSVIMDKVRYRVTLPEELAVDLEAKAAAFLALESLPVKREKKGKASEFDLRHELAELKVEGRALELVAGRGKLLEFASAILGVPADALKEARLEKLEVVFKP